MAFVRLSAGGWEYKSGRSCGCGRASGAGRGCLGIDIRHAALTAAFYTMWSSVLVVAVYLWRIALNTAHPEHLEDVYYGVQISYVSTLLSHVTLAALSYSLLIGVQQERMGLVTPWMVANMSFMALEAVCCMYSNVLRDHVNRRFDGLCRAELIFFCTRFVLNVLSVWAVMRFVKNIRAGQTFRDPDIVQL